MYANRVGISDRKYYAYALRKAFKNAYTIGMTQTKSTEALLLDLMATRDAMVAIVTDPTKSSLDRRAADANALQLSEQINSLFQEL